MKKSIVKVACGILIMLVVIAGASACAPKTVDEITDAALQAMNDGDYEEFLKYYTPADRSLLTEGEFDENCRLIKDTVGDYIDKEFWKTEEGADYTIFYYKANYSDAPEDIPFAFYIEEVNGENYIAGVWWEFPELEE